MTDNTRGLLCRFLMLAMLHARNSGLKPCPIPTPTGYSGALPCGHHPIEETTMHFFKHVYARVSRWLHPNRGFVWAQDHWVREGSAEAKQFWDGLRARTRK